MASPQEEIPDGFTKMNQTSPRPQQQRVRDGFIITIDGPIGSGKTRLAKIGVEHFGMIHLDLSRVYRAAAFINSRTPPETSEERTPDLEEANDRLGKCPPGNFMDEMELALKDHHNIPDVQLLDCNLWKGAAKFNRWENIREMVTQYVGRYKEKHTKLIVEGFGVGKMIPEAQIKIYCTAPMNCRVHWMSRLFRGNIKQLSLNILEQIMREVDVQNGYETIPSEYWVGTMLPGTMVLSTPELSDPCDLLREFITIVDTRGGLSPIGPHRIKRKKTLRTKVNQIIHQEIHDLYIDDDVTMVLLCDVFCPDEEEVKNSTYFDEVIL